MNIKTFIENNKLTMEKLKVFDNPNMDTTGWEANHYQIKITNGTNGKMLTTHYSQGIGIKNSPKLPDVLDCIASDADCDATFEEWCDAIGYDTDSIKAKKTYDACTKMAIQLRTLLGREQFNILLQEVERL